MAPKKLRWSDEGKGGGEEEEIGKIRKANSISNGGMVTRSSSTRRRSLLNESDYDELLPKSKKPKSSTSATNSKGKGKGKGKGKRKGKGGKEAEKIAAAAVAVADDLESEEEAAPQPSPATETSKTIVIEHCKQCTSFKTRAFQVKIGLENGLPGITVLVNPEKPRRGCFEIREEGGEKFICLLDMKRPFTPMKALDMDKVISDVIAKIK